MKHTSNEDAIHQFSRTACVVWAFIGAAALWSVNPLPSHAQEPNACNQACRAAVTDVLGRAAVLIDRFQLSESSAPVRERAGWSSPKRIVTVYAVMAPLLSHLAPGAEIVTVLDTSEVAGVIAGADVYIGRCTPAMIEAGVDLKWIQIDRAGAETCADHPELVERGVLVTNLQRILSPAIADHAIAMMYALARALPQYDSERPAERWSHPITSPGNIPLVEVEGKTMLVVGLGGIGTEIARKANGIGMRVVATRNSRREGPDFVEYVGLAHEVEELAASADVVVNAAPLTDDTRGMFDESFFAAMQETAYFINIGRGESVVTADLVTALEAGSIAGAGLDVTDPEPLLTGHPLWSMTNVVLTPHIAGIADCGHTSRSGTLMFENLRRYIAGDRMLSVVDLSRGY